MMKTKTFDCVEMKRQGQRRIHERLKGMTVEQQIEYWRKRSEAFMQEQERIRTQRPSAPAESAPGRK
jgi:hypothetical protein